ncbi:MAG: SURF1 family protein [Micrococcaceae bacterium]|nr:SURF1 family protein [Micrococcaceae bacterium]
MLRTALKPRWIGFFLLTMVVAALFVLLTQWQFEQSTANQPRDHAETETPVALTEHFEPGAPMMTDQADQMVTFRGNLNLENTVQVESRVEEGNLGLWLVSEATVDGAPDGYRIPVAWGWVEEEIEADTAELTEMFEQATDVSAQDMMEFEGRLIPGEGPTPNTNHASEPVRKQMLATSQLVNLWDQDLYAGYVVAEKFTVDSTEHVVSGATDVQPVDVAPQPEETEVAWLNIFYAIEWFIFAVFSLFLWWRFVRDDYLKDQREEELDELWEQHWRAQELQRLRDQARKEKVAAEQAYRAYHGYSSDDQKDSRES